MYIYFPPSSCFLSFVAIFSFIVTSQGAPRLPSESHGINEDLKPIGKLAYSIESPSPQSSGTSAVPSENGNNFLTILSRFFEKNDIVSSLFHLISKASEQAAKNADTQEKEKIYGDTFLKATTTTSSVPLKEKTLEGEVQSPPIPKPDSRSPVINGNRISGAKTSENAGKPIPMNDDSPVINEFSVDSAPTAISRPDSKFPPMDNEWKSTLFGPKGMLTEVFRFVNEKRKQGFEKAPQADLPPGGGNANLDFAKILDSLLKSNGNGFDEPKIPELPFIGICNRLNCGDIYKAVDEFKKSEMFSNFQTAISLLQDPKGLDIIGELLENPDLIEQYVGNPATIQGLLGKSTASGSKKPSGSSMAILPSDGDLGTDFTNEVDGGKPVNIATSIDAGGDYYSAVDKAPSKDYDYDGVETVNIEEKVPTEPPKKAEAAVPLLPKKAEPPLPELSFSVDETPEIESSIDVEPVEYGTGVAVEEVVPNGKGEAILKKPPTALERRFVTTSTVPPRTLTTTTRPLTTVEVTTKLTPTIKPKVNFRKSNDYYSMYYDS